MGDVVMLQVLGQELGLVVALRVQMRIKLALDDALRILVRFSVPDDVDVDLAHWDTTEARQISALNMCHHCS